MNTAEHDFAESLLHIFDNVLITEEKALSKGYFADLSIAELHTLDAIGPYEARAMSETAIRLGITTGTLTVAVDRLVRKGYVERNRDTKDRRVVRIHLTRRGKLAFRMHGKFHTLLVRRIMEPLDTERQEILAEMIRNIDQFVSEQYRKYSDEDIKNTAMDDSRRSLEDV